MKVAIVGYGEEGKASYSYWSKKGDEVTIVDENQQLADIPDGAQTLLGPQALGQLTDFDLIIRTPPLRPDRINTHGKVWSSTNEFFSECPAPIIGVTGTKGKGTTCSLIASILDAAGKTVHLVGNIGVPALGELPAIHPSGIVVFELSSFQLWDLEKSPETAVVLMIEPDHMDVHASLEEYLDAKANIGTHQTPDNLMVYHPTNNYSAQIAGLSAAHKRRYMSQEGAYITNDIFTIDNQAVCHVSEVSLIGPHNQENICAAITAAWSYTQDIAAIRKGVIECKGLPHRLEFVAAVNGVQYYDDSQATGAGSTLAALRSFTLQPTVLILGGSDKGVDVTSVINELDPARHFVVLVGQTSSKLELLLKARNFGHYVNLGTNVKMPEVVQAAAQHATKKGVVLLSPAHASFGMFKNYQDRGDQFKAAVRALGL